MKLIDQAVPIGAGCRGINLYSDPRVLGDDEIVQGVNLFPNVQGNLDTRPTVGFSELAPAASQTIYGFAAVAAETGLRFVMAENVGGVGKLKAWADYASPVSVNLAQPLVKRPLFLDFLGETLCFPRNGEEGVYVLRKPDGAAAAVWVHRSFVITAAEATATGVTAQPQIAAVCPEVAFVYSGGGRQRLVLANFGAGDETVFVMSDDEYPATYKFDPATYLPYWVLVGADVMAFNAARASTLPDQETDAIAAGHAIQLQAVGSPVSEGALLLGSKDAYILQGAFLETTDTSSNNPIGTAALSRINLQCGCAAQGTVTKTPYGLIWAGPDDVWLLDLAGQLPRRIGTKIRPALQSGAPADRWRWTGAYFNGVFVLGVCTAAELISGGSVAPDAYCSFDYYWLDLRNGPPHDPAAARWFGPMRYSVTDLGPNGAALDAFTGLGQLVSVNGSGQTGDTVLALLPAWEGTVACVVDVASQLGSLDVASKVLADPLAWPAASLVEVGRTVSPTVPNGFLFVCTTAGTTGGSEPAWGGSGSVVADNTVTWTEVSAGASSVLGNPLSNAGYVGVLNAVGAPDFDLQTKEYSLGSVFNQKTLSALELAMQSSQPQQLNVEFQQEMGSKVESTTGQLAALGAALPFTLGTKLVSEQPSYRAIRPNDGSRVVANTFRFRAYPSDGFVVDTSNQIIGFQGGFVLVQVTPGVYATIDALMARIAADVQTAWRAVGLGAGGTVAYSVGDGGGGFPVFSRFRPVKLTWAGFTALGQLRNLHLPGPLVYAGFEDPTRCGTFTDNGSIYAHALVAPINPTRWRFIAGQLRARMWSRRSLSKQG